MGTEGASREEQEARVYRRGGAVRHIRIAVGAELAAVRSVEVELGEAEESEGACSSDHSDHKFYC